MSHSSSNRSSAFSRPDTPHQSSLSPGNTEELLNESLSHPIDEVPSTPPKNPPSGGIAARSASGSLNTPRAPKPGPTHLDRSNNKEARKHDAGEAKVVWNNMLRNNFAGITPIDEFLETYLPKPESEGPTVIDKIVAGSSATLAKAETALRGVKIEDGMAPPLLLYLKKVASKLLPKKNRPAFGDTHTTPFESLDKGDHYTMPDITTTRPGARIPKKWEWAKAGTVLELKFKTDIFDKYGEINDSDKSRDALLQLAKSARSLLMASGSCFVFLVAVFDRSKARIFRFDHAGFRASSAFSWVDEPKIFPTFFYRLYNPQGHSRRMYGEDDTISRPTARQKKRMYKALCTNPFYRKLYPSMTDATKHSLCIKAVRFRSGEGEDATPIPQIVNCFTIGPIISYSDGLFSRATHVYRVILKEDADTGNPTVYALKDAWRQGCRRPEIHFYEVIAQYCKENKIDMDKEGLARCHGSVDLSVAVDSSPLPWDPALHQTCSTGQTDNTFERCHMRLLLTPVGRSLRSFPSTKSLVQALYTAVLQHQLAYRAGVLHRDVSEGNVLFREAVEPGMDPKAFLVDWDYAEFTEAGLRRFNTSPERIEASKAYQDIDKSLKDLTGTFPFLAIETANAENITVHGPHHDLESVYWLLVWMILRHTRHSHPDAGLACGRLFDLEGTATKRAWIGVRSPVPDDTSPLHKITDWLRYLVRKQNPDYVATNDPFVDELPAAAVQLTYDAVMLRFTSVLGLPDWPENDSAIPFVLPSIKDAATEGNTKSRPNLLKETLERQRTAGSSKRAREEEDASTAVAGGASISKRAKTEPVPHKTKAPPRRNSRSKPNKNP